MAKSAVPKLFRTWPKSEFGENLAAKFVFIAVYLFLKYLRYTKFGRSHFFRLRLHTCSKMFESGSWFGNFSNMRIRLLFRLRLPSIQPKFTHAFLKIWEVTPALGGVLHKMLTPGADLGLKMQNPAGVDSGTPDPWPPLRYAYRPTQTCSGNIQFRFGWPRRDSFLTLRHPCVVFHIYFMNHWVR